MLMRAGAHVKQRVNADAAYIGGSSRARQWGYQLNLYPIGLSAASGAGKPPAKRREAGDSTAPALQALDQTQRCHVVNAWSGGA